MALTGHVSKTETAGASSLPYLAFAGACLIWGSTFLVIRVGNQAVAPLWAATLRLLLATPLLALIVFLRGDGWPTGAALKGALLFGAFNFGFNLALLYWGERVVPSGIAAVIYATVPLSTALIAAALRVEVLTMRTLAAAVVALGGVATIFAGEMRLDVPSEGLIAVFLAAVAAALSSVLLKRAPRQPSVFATNAVGSLVGAVICLAGSIALGEDRPLPGSFAAWWPVIYLTCAGSLGAYILYTWLLTHWSATNASYTGVVAPVIAVTLGALLLDETRAAETYVGTAIVMVSVIFALRSRATGH